MNNPSALSELIRPLFAPAERGVVGLVDALLETCRDRDLQLEWQDETCRVRSTGAVPEDTIAVPLAKSVFRAILARLAALCNEHNPGSVSPYGGAGEVIVGTDPAIVCAVAFTNTPHEQRVQLTRVATHEVQGPSDRLGVETWQELRGGHDTKGSVAIGPTA